MGLMMVEHTKVGGEFRPRSSNKRRMEDVEGHGLVPRKVIIKTHGPWAQGALQLPLYLFHGFHP